MLTSPATVRLMGLLVIVGMVAGCGAASRDVSEAVPANDEVVPADEEIALVLETIQAACVEVSAEAERQHYPTARCDVTSAHEASYWQYEHARGLARTARLLTDLSEACVENGEHESAHKVLVFARSRLDAAQTSLDLARKLRRSE